MKAAHIYSSAACHRSKAVSSDDQAVPSTIDDPSPAALPGKSRKARNTVGGKQRRKGRKKIGRPKSKAWSLTTRHLRGHCPKYLRRTEVLNLIQADLFAARIGRPLTAFISIRWALTEQGEANINRRWSTLLNALRIWSNRKGFEWTAIGVHENPPRTGPAFNSHLLAAIPDALHMAAVEWLMKRLGGSAGAVDIRPRVYPGRADETLRYTLKGCDPQTAQSFGIAYKYQGVVPFQRSTTSRNINARAREAWKYSGTIRISDQYARAKDRLLTADNGAAA